LTAAKARTITELAVAKAASASPRVNHLGNVATAISKVAEVSTDSSRMLKSCSQVKDSSDVLNALAKVLNGIVCRFKYQTPTWDSMIL